MAPAAVIAPADTASADLTVEALARQTVRPGRVIAIESVAALPDAVEEAYDCDRSWLWLLDGGVVPEPDALENLLAAADGAEPAPALLVSKVLSPDGTLDPASLPVPEVHRSERVLAALARHAVALRVARRGSMLVTHAALRQTGAENALARDLEWSARLLRDELGLLVPASIATRTGAQSRPAPAPRPAAAVRTLAALEPGNRLWFAVHFAEQALESRRARRRV